MVKQGKPKGTSSGTTHRRRLVKIVLILSACRATPLTVNKIVHLCAMEYSAAKRAVGVLVTAGFLSHSVNRGVSFYGATKLGLELVQRYEALQELVVSLEGSGVI